MKHLDGKKIETMEDIPVILRCMLFVGIIIFGNWMVYQMVLNCSNSIPNWLPPLVYVFLTCSLIFAELSIIFPECKRWDLK